MVRPDGSDHADDANGQQGKLWSVQGNGDVYALHTMQPQDRAD